MQSENETSGARKGCEAVTFAIAPLLAAACSYLSVIEDTDETWLRVSRAQFAPNDPGQYWGEVSEECVFEFGGLLARWRSNPNRRALLSRWVEIFAQEQRPESVMRWWLASQELFAPPRNGKYISNGAAAALQNLASEVLVKKLVSDRNVMGKYYRLAAWRGTIFSTQSRNMYMEALRNALIDGNDTEHYWWHARHAILLMYATGRGDLLEAEPSKLVIATKKWFDWFRANGMYLRPTSTDFPRWQLSKSLVRAKLGYVPFFTEHRELPPIVIKCPFLKWRGVVLLKPHSAPYHASLSLRVYNKDSNR